MHRPLQCHPFSLCWQATCHEERLLASTTGSHAGCVRVLSCRRSQVGLESLNESEHFVKVLDPKVERTGDKVKRWERFSIELDAPLAEGQKYERGGVASQKKQPVLVEFAGLKECLMEKPKIDDLMHSDWSKWFHPEATFCAMRALDTFKSKHSRAPRAWHTADAEELLAMSEQHRKEYDGVFNNDVDDGWKALVRTVAFTCAGELSPLVAYVGGVVAQEVLKALTAKFMPIRQWSFVNAVEVIPESLSPETYASELAAAVESKVTAALGKVTDDLAKVLGKVTDDIAKVLAMDGATPYGRSRGALNSVCLGPSLYEKVRAAHVFMVGSGAIGCELLKNYAMLGVGTRQEGRITMTDPDCIENSNLSRQFLFREKHIRLNKCACAGAAAVAMNPELSGRVFPFEEYMKPDTENIFSDGFFDTLDCVTNALDNVKARLYVDSRCVSTRTPLLEPGTLGPKGASPAPPAPAASWPNAVARATATHTLARACPPTGSPYSLRRPLLVAGCWLLVAGAAAFCSRFFF